MNEFFKIRTKTGETEFRVRKFTKWPNNERKTDNKPQKDYCRYKLKHTDSNKLHNKQTKKTN